MSQIGYTQVLKILIKFDQCAPYTVDSRLVLFKRGRRLVHLLLKVKWVVTSFMYQRQHATGLVLCFKRVILPTKNNTS